MCQPLGQKAYFSNMGSGNRYQDDAIGRVLEAGVQQRPVLGSASVGAGSRQAGQQHSEAEDQGLGRGAELLPLVTVASAVVAGRCSSQVAMRTPSYLISGMRCLCHNLKEIELHGLWIRSLVKLGLWGLLGFVLFHKNITKGIKSEIHNSSSSYLFYKHLLIYMHSTGTHSTDANVFIFPDGKTEGEDGRERFVQLQRKVEIRGRVRFQKPSFPMLCSHSCLGALDSIHCICLNNEIKK